MLRNHRLMSVVAGLSLALGDATHGAILAKARRHYPAAKEAGGA